MSLIPNEGTFNISINMHAAFRYFPKHLCDLSPPLHISSRACRVVFLQPNLLHFAGVRMPKKTSEREKDKNFA